MRIERIKWIDIAKGMGIIFIVLGHILRGTGIMIQWIYSFNVPFFFVLAGLTFNKDNAEAVRTIKAKGCQLLVPYVFWGLVSIIIFACFGGGVFFNQY